MIEFALTEEDKYIMFPMINQNPKAPKFILKKTDKDKGNPTGEQ